MASHEENLAVQTSAKRKREIYTGIHLATPDTRPVHLCWVPTTRREAGLRWLSILTLLWGSCIDWQWLNLECGRTRHRGLSLIFVPACTLIPFLYTRLEAMAVLTMLSGRCIRSYILRLAGWSDLRIFRFTSCSRNSTERSSNRAVSRIMASGSRWTRSSYPPSTNTMTAPWSSITHPALAVAG